MHDPHPTNALVAPQPIGPLTLRPTVLGDGRPAVIVSWGPVGVSATGLACDSRMLRSAVGNVGVDVAILCPEGTPVGPLLHAATACDATTPLLATRRPVTDAIKRVAGRDLIETLDRTSLAWAAPPAVVHLPTLVPWLDAATGDVIRPLTGSWARLTWL